MVSIVVILVAGVVLEGLFGGVEQCGLAQSAKGGSQRYEEAIC